MTHGDLTWETMAYIGTPPHFDVRGWTQFLVRVDEKCAAATLATCDTFFRLPSCKHSTGDTLFHVHVHKYVHIWRYIRFSIERKEAIDRFSKNVRPSTRTEWKVSLIAVHWKTWTTLIQCPVRVLHYKSSELFAPFN